MFYERHRAYTRGIMHCQLESPSCQTCCLCRENGASSSSATAYNQPVRHTMKSSVATTVQYMAGDNAGCGIPLYFYIIISYCNIFLFCHYGGVFMWCYQVLFIHFVVFRYSHTSSCIKKSWVFRILAYLGICCIPYRDVMWTKMSLSAGWLIDESCCLTQCRVQLGINFDHFTTGTCVRLYFRMSVNRDLLLTGVSGSEMSIVSIPT